MHFNLIIYQDVIQHSCKCQKLFMTKFLAISSNFKVKEYPKFSYINKIMLLYSICHLIKNPPKMENKNQI